MENPTSATRDHATPPTPPTDLRTRHSQALARLMADREDLRGINGFADLIDDSLRWTA